MRARVKEENHNSWILVLCHNWPLNMRAGVFSSVQTSPLTNWVVEATWPTIQQRFPSSTFLHEALVSSSGMGRDVHALIVSVQHLLCRPRRRPSSKVPWGMVLTDCRGAWHDRTVRVSVSWQLPKEVPVDPQGSWCCSSSSCWSCTAISSISYVEHKPVERKVTFESWWSPTTGRLSMRARAS